MMLKTFFILEIFTCFSWLFHYAEKRFDKKAKVNFEIYDVTDPPINNYNKHITQYLKKYRQPGNEF